MRPFSLRVCAQCLAAGESQPSYFKHLRPFVTVCDRLWPSVSVSEAQKTVTFLDLCVSSLRRGHANLLCIVPIFTDDPEGFQLILGSS